MHTLRICASTSGGRWGAKEPMAGPGHCSWGRWRWGGTQGLVLWGPEGQTHPDGAGPAQSGHTALDWRLHACGSLDALGGTPAGPVSALPADRPSLAVPFPRPSRQHQGHRPGPRWQRLLSVFRDRPPAEKPARNPQVPTGQPCQGPLILAARCPYHSEPSKGRHFAGNRVPGQRSQTVSHGTPGQGPREPRKPPFILQSAPGLG